MSPTGKYIGRRKRRRGLKFRHMDVAMQLSVFRQFFRWLALIIFMILALLLFYSSMYSVWMSGGPSNPYALGWYRHAIGNLCFAIGALFFGIGLFKGIRTFPGATKGSAAFILLGAIVAISPYIGHFVLIDKCLDRGGRWNHGTIQCSDE